MSKSSSLVIVFSAAALGVALIALFRGSERMPPQSPVERKVAQVAPADSRVDGLVAEVEALKGEVERLRVAMVSVANAQPMTGPPGGVPNWAMPEQRVPDGPLVPAHQIAATRRLRPMTDQALATLVENARARVPESLTAVTAADLGNMVTTYEWGAGDDRRMWRLIDGTAYYEVYPDGGYSVLPILGRATVNGTPGVILTKDDGGFDVFIPDKGGRMVHQIRAARTQSPWMDYRPMENVE